MSGPARTAACLAHLGGGFLLWSSCFVVLYALLSLGCEAGWGGWLRPVLAAAWALHLLAIAAVLALQWKMRAAAGDGEPLAPPRSLQGPALALTTAALLATAWIGWPVLALPACAGSELRVAAPPS